MEWDGEVFIVVTKYIQWSIFNPTNYDLRAHIYSHLIQAMTSLKTYVSDDIIDA
ncbi:hypothetical protein LguiA_004870 [Lonicera macranthoides]